MLRVLRPGGVMLWYDYHVDNPRNADVRGVTEARDARAVSRCRLDLRRVTLAPPLARALAPHSRLACQLLEAIPFLRTPTVLRDLG